MDKFVINFYLKVPGKVLRGGLKESWTGPNPGWIQYCDAVEVDEKGNVSMIGGAPLDLKVCKSYLSNYLPHSH